MAAFRHLLPALLLLAGTLTLVPAGAAEPDLPDLFVAGAEGTFAEAGNHAVRINTEALRTLRAGQRARVRLPGVLDRAARLDRIEQHANGDTTWIGQFDGGDERHRFVVTHGAGGMAGTLRAPEGIFLADSAGGGRLRDIAAAGLERAATCQPTLPVRHGEGPAVASGENGFAAGETEIDVMVLYTPGLASASGGATTVINQLVAVANQAYTDSGVGIRLRLVHAAQVSYADAGDNDIALENLSDGTGVFASVEALRTEKGADMVVLLRPYNRSTHGSCGVAWLNGGGGFALTRDGAYAVVSHGDDGNYYCDDYTFAHELGHNMGSAHDLAHSSSQGAFPYSYGYGFSGIFGTIMSYIDPVIGRFSNPSITCSGRPCGTSSANNTLSLNNTRTTVAAFTAARSATTLTGITVSPASIAVGASATITPVPSAASLGSCTSSNTAVARISGSTVTGVAAGSATITCSGLTATVSVTAGSGTSSQAFAPLFDEIKSLSGNVALSVGFRPKGSDIGKSAEIFVAANIVQSGRSEWFVLGSGGWSYGLNLVPIATRTLSATEQGLRVLNYDFTESTLRAMQADVYVAYRTSGGDLVYGIARSYR